MECPRCGYDEHGRLFCAACGKLIEAGSLSKVRIAGFTGRFSTNPNVEQFLATGDPSVFERDDRPRLHASAQH